MVYDHRIPSDLTPTGTITVPVSIPHDPQWIGLLLGALITLEETQYYQRDPNFDNENSKIVTAQWRERTITPLIQAIADGDICGVPMSFPSGSSMAYFGGTAPSGWLFCDGSAVSRATYADLFSAIGTTYGAGDGSTTFNLPDLRGRSPLGAGQGSGLSNRTLGAKIGAENHQLTTAEMPSHTHNNIVHEGASPTFAANNFASAYTREAGTNRSGNQYIEAAGGDTAHNNMHPVLVCNFIIKI